ncbi:hypothetical protein VYU27_007202 [Nannochloropsis oceanica]
MAAEAAQAGLAEAEPGVPSTPPQGHDEGEAVKEEEAAKRRMTTTVTMSLRAERTTMACSLALWSPLPQS